MAIVCVDTTEFHSSPLLDGSGWPQMLARSRQGAIGLVVSEVSIREAGRQFRRKAAKAERDLGSEAATLRGLGISVEYDAEALDSGVERAGQGYEERLRQRLTEHGATILPLPDVSHDDLLERDLATRKPFNESGKGYRDSLIWEALLEYLAEAPPGQEVVLVTGNSKDFAESKENPAIAATLAEEVADLGRHHSVERVPSLVEALRLAMLVPVFDAFDHPSHSIEATVRDAVLAAADELAGTDIDSPELLGLPPQLSDVSIQEVQARAESFFYEVYDELDFDTLLIKASLEGEVEFDGFIDKGDFPRYEAELSVWDGDWNATTMWVTATSQATLSFDVTVIGTEIEEIRLDYIE